MLKASLIRRRTTGAFCSTSRSLFWWGYKDNEFHRLARQRPWWETAAILGGLLIFVNMSSAFLYGLNRCYQRWRPSGNELQVREAIDQILFSRPDLAVAAVRMMLHHSLSNTQTPFGCPVVAPEVYREEAEEIVDFIWNLNKDQPSYTFPDLWAMLTAKALARLGGPNVVPYRGRDDLPEFMNRDLLLAFPRTLIDEDNRDVLSMKRVLSRQGLSLEKLVALIGCDRCIGFHDAAGFHTREIVKPKMKQRQGLVGPDNNEFHLPATILKTTMDPYVFGSEYFNLLLDYKWRQQGLFAKKEGIFRCDAKERARNVTLLDPFSEKTLESQRRRAEAASKARDCANETNRRNGENSSIDGSTSNSRFDRSGEAQFIPGARGVREQGATGDTEGRSPDLSDDPDYEIERPALSQDPCMHVSMRGMDVMLLDDGLTKGWLYRFADDELEFYAAVSEVVLDIQKRGHNPNNLSLWK